MHPACLWALHPTLGLWALHPTLGLGASLKSRRHLPLQNVQMWPPQSLPLFLPGWCLLHT